MTPKVFIPLLGLTTLVSASVGFAFVESKLSYEQHGARDHLALQGEGRDRDEGWTNGKDRTSGKGGAGVHGVPGPVAGAGLPIMAIGLGAYWLVRRHRRKTA